MKYKNLLSIILFGLSFAGVQAQGNGTVCVEIFNDLNANGILDAGEPGVQDINISVIAAPASEQLFEPAMTDITGIYCFTELDYGQYTLAVEVPQGWEITGSGSPFFNVNITEEQNANAFRLALTPQLNTRETNLNNFYVYPNPVASVLTLRGVAARAGEISIYDLPGKRVITQLLTAAETKIDVTRLGPGVYIINIVSGKEVTTKKICIFR